MFVQFVAAHPILALGTVMFGCASRSFVAFGVAFVGLAFLLT